MSTLELYDLILDRVNDHRQDEVALLTLEEVLTRGLTRVKLALNDIEANKPKKPGPKPGTVRKPKDKVNGEGDASSPSQAETQSQGPTPY